MADQIAQNTFDGGLNLDVNPLTVPNNVLSDCLNGTFTTYNGQDMTLQNDMGNASITYGKTSTSTGKLVSLKDGYIPIGSASLGGILYIASYNPLTELSELGTFPSPDYQNIESEYTGNYTETSTDIEESFLSYLISNTEQMFTIVDSNNEPVVLFEGDYIKDFSFMKEETSTTTNCSNIQFLINYGYITPEFYAGDVLLEKIDDSYYLTKQTTGNLVVKLIWTPQYDYKFHFDTAKNNAYIKFVKLENENWSSEKESVMEFENTSTTTSKTSGDYTIFENVGDEDFEIELTGIIKITGGTEFYKYNYSQKIKIDKEEFDETKNNSYIINTYRYEYDSLFKNLNISLRKIDSLTSTILIKDSDSEAISDSTVTYINGMYKVEYDNTTIYRPAPPTQLYNEYYDKYVDNDFLNIQLEYTLDCNNYSYNNTTNLSNLFKISGTETTTTETTKTYSDKFNVSKSFNTTFSIKSDNIKSNYIPYELNYTKTITYSKEIGCNKNELTGQNESAYNLTSLTDLQSFSKEYLSYRAEGNHKSTSRDSHQLYQVILPENFYYGVNAVSSATITAICHIDSTSISITYIGIQVVEDEIYLIKTNEVNIYKYKSDGPDSIIEVELYTDDEYQINSNSGKLNGTTIETSTTTDIYYELNYNSDDSDDSYSIYYDQDLEKCVKTESNTTIANPEKYQIDTEGNIDLTKKQVYYQKFLHDNHDGCVTKKYSELISDIAGGVEVDNHTLINFLFDKFSEQFVFTGGLQCVAIDNQGTDAINLSDQSGSDGYDQKCALFWKTGSNSFIICVFDTKYNKDWSDGNTSRARVDEKHVTAIKNARAWMNRILNNIYIPSKQNTEKIEEYINSIIITDDLSKEKISDKFEFTLKLDLDYQKMNNLHRFRYFWLLGPTSNNLTLELDTDNNQINIKFINYDSLTEKFNSFVEDLQSEVDNKVQSFVEDITSGYAVILTYENSGVTYFNFEDFDGSTFISSGIYINNSSDSEIKLHFSDKFTYKKFGDLPSCVPNEDSFSTGESIYNVYGGPGHGDADTKFIFNGITSVLLPYNSEGDLEELYK